MNSTAKALLGVTACSLLGGVYYMQMGAEQPKVKTRLEDRIQNELLNPTPPSEQNDVQDMLAKVAESDDI